MLHNLFIPDPRGEDFLFVGTTKDRMEDIRKKVDELIGRLVGKSFVRVTAGPFKGVVGYSRGGNDADECGKKAFVDVMTNNTIYVPKDNLEVLFGLGEQIYHDGDGKKKFNVSGYKFDEETGIVKVCCFTDGDINFFFDIEDCVSVDACESGDEDEDGDKNEDDGVMQNEEAVEVEEAVGTLVTEITETVDDEFENGDIVSYVVEGGKTLKKKFCIGCVVNVTETELIVRKCYLPWGEEDDENRLCITKRSVIKKYFNIFKNLDSQDWDLNEEAREDSWFGKLGVLKNMVEYDFRRSFMENTLLEAVENAEICFRVVSPSHPEGKAVTFYLSEFVRVEKE